MAQFKITKKIDFGPYTITGPTGGKLDNVLLNNYAPKVGDIIEGTLETKTINDGNGHSSVKTGIVWPIRTNGAQSTQAQTSIQFITQDYFVPYQSSGSGDDSNTTPHPMDPVNPSDNNVVNSSNTAETESSCWFCDNWLVILIVITIIVALVVAFKD